MYPMRPALEKEVILTNMCTACGGCAAICPVHAIIVDEHTANIDHTCIGCIWCDYVCPVLETYDKEVGYYKEVVSAKSDFQGQDGGITQKILHKLFEIGEVDCIVGVGHDERWKPLPMIVDKKEDIINLALSKYTFTPLLETLIKAVKTGYKKIALTGVGCQVSSAALFRENFPEYGRTMVCLIGLICTKTFKYDDFFGYLKEQNLSVNDIKKIDITKGKIIVEGLKDTFKEKVQKLGHLSRTGCNYCEDVPAFSADITLGAVGAKPGYNSVIIRSYEGQRIWNLVKDSVTIDEINPDLISRLQIMKRREVRDTMRA